MVISKAEYELDSSFPIQQCGCHDARTQSILANDTPLLPYCATLDTDMETILDRINCASKIRRWVSTVNIFSYSWHLSQEIHSKSLISQTALISCHIYIWRLKCCDLTNWHSRYFVGVSTQILIEVGSRGGSQLFCRECAIYILWLECAESNIFE